MSSTLSFGVSHSENRTNSSTPFVSLPFGLASRVDYVDGRHGTGGPIDEMVEDVPHDNSLHARESPRRHAAQEHAGRGRAIEPIQRDRRGGEVRLLDPASGGVLPRVARSEHGDSVGSCDLPAIPGQ